MNTAVRKQLHRARPTPKPLSSLIPKLVGQHGPEDVRAALIQSWARANGAGEHCLRRCKQTQQFLARTNPRVCEPVCEKLLASTPDFSLKHLEGGLESLNGNAKRRRQGIVYTPDEVIDYLLDCAIRDVQPNSAPPVVCDPACGSGGFLLRAARLLSERYGLSVAAALRDHVVGIDCDREALANARCLIELALVQKGEFSSTDPMRLICGDSLLTPTAKLLSQAGVERGFPVIASNPPYVKLQNLDQSYRRMLEEKYRPYIKGSYSLALLFLIAGHRMLADGGSLAYITQNNLFTSLAGEPVREFLQRERCLRRILDFTHAKVFDKAAAYTCLVFLGTEPRDHVEYESLSEQPTRDSLCRIRYSPVPHAKLNPKKWRLAKPHHLENLERIERLGKPLGEVAEIRVGFATLKDRVFLVRDAGDHCLATGSNGEAVVVEREITRPAVKIADLNEELDLANNRRRIIFPYVQSARRYDLMSEQRMRREFPLTFAYLQSCRDLLDARDKGKCKAEAWYAWGRTQGRAAPGPKLLTKTFDCRPNFMLDRSDQLFCNGYSVSLKADAPSWLTIELLQALLNSPVMHYYAKLTSFQIAGGFQCYQKNFIERFGVPTFNQEDAQQLMSLDRETRDQRIVSDLYGLECWQLSC